MTPKLLKVIGHRGVAGKKNSMTVSLNQVAIVTTVIVALQARAPMLDRDGGDINFTRGSFD